MKPQTQFSKYATHYGKYNVIQEQVADKVLSHVKGTPQKILDLGCGSGALVKRIGWKYQKFVGVDLAEGMLQLHPKAPNIICMHGDFNDPLLYEQLLTQKFDQILSASALQWSQDLEMVFSQLQKFNTPLSLALFTSKTFQTLYKTASLPPLLITKEKLYELQKRYFDLHFEVVEYRLEFANTKEIFQYIKKSGVSGSRNVLSYKQTKQLMREYPVNYLEFEVCFLYS
ncbi:MAG: methyltransferase domain-containing protein [Epsilonproteobacteria bacterium]|nr:methyltransferase domain-containing protein [Campylobacterota bacterium]